MAARTSRKSQIAFGLKLGFTPGDAKLLACLDSPEKIQDYLDAIPVNHEEKGETCLAAAGALRLGAAHCIEGALIAAAALWIKGEAPLLLDFQAEGDDDHVVALFKRGGCWGAISKSNHAWLRWRDPIYRTLRELSMSYFHEYVARDKKTLRTYSRPFDLSRHDPAVWASSTASCWDLAETLDQSPHTRLITANQAKALRRRDAFEQHLGTMVEYPGRKNPS